MSEVWDERSERAVLGAVLSDGAMLPALRAALHSEHFHQPAHQRIWEAMGALVEAGKPVDHLTLALQLQQRGHLGEAGGPDYLMQLDREAPVVANAMEYAETLKDRAIRRRLAALGRQLIQDAADLARSPLEVQAGASAKLVEVGAMRSRRRTLTEHLAENFEHVREIEAGHSAPIIPTGLAKLDELIGGWQPTLNIVGARTGVGKSAFLATAIQNVAMQGYRVGVFSLEDEGDWLAWRYMAHGSGVPQFVLRYRKKSDDEWERVGNSEPAIRAWSDRVTVDDRPGLTAEELCLEADDMVATSGAQIIFVDHLKEMNHHAQKRDRHDLNMERSLQIIRAMQKRHKIPVVIAHQMNEDRDQKSVPTLFDFSDGKVVGKMARVAMALTREPSSDVMTIHILKQTGGVIGKSVDVRFLDGAAMIRDLEGHQHSMPFTPRAPSRGRYTNDEDDDT